MESSAQVNAPRQRTSATVAPLEARAKKDSIQRGSAASHQLEDAKRNTPQRAWDSQEAFHLLFFKLRLYGDLDGVAHEDASGMMQKYLSC